MKVAFSTASSYQPMAAIAENRLVKAISVLAQKILRILTAILDFILPRNPVTGKRQLHLLPTFAEKFLGRALYASALSHYGVIGETNSRHGGYVRMVKEVGAELAAKSPRKGLDFEFNVVASSKDNAWCLPGGKIAINLGLIRHMDEEASFGIGEFSLKEKIAAVLSHEITHATARHTGRTLEFIAFLLVALKIVEYAITSLLLNQPQKEFSRNRMHSYSPITNLLSEWTFTLFTLCNSRKNEFEADKYGMHLFWEASKTSKIFDQNSPRVSIWLQHFFKHSHPDVDISWIRWIQGFFHTHPSSEDRIKANEKTWQELTCAAPSA